MSWQASLIPGYDREKDQTASLVVCDGTMSNNVGQLLTGSVKADCIISICHYQYETTN